MPTCVYTPGRGGHEGFAHVLTPRCPPLSAKKTQPQLVEWDANRLQGKVTLRHADPAQHGLLSDTGTVKTGLKLLTSASVSPAAIMAPGVSAAFCSLRRGEREGRGGRRTRGDAERCRMRIPVPARGRFYSSSVSHATTHTHHQVPKIWWQLLVIGFLGKQLGKAE